MFKLNTIALVAIIGGLSCLASGQRVAAQQAQKPEAARKSDDAEARERILMSDKWRQATKEFSEWLSVQVVYTPKQAEQLKAKLAAQVGTMSAEELQAFLNEWDAKLKVALATDASEARVWLGMNFAVMADGYRQEFLKKLGLNDASNMTAQQVEDAVIRVGAKRLALQQQNAAFERSREAMVESIRKIKADDQAALDKAASQPAATFGVQTPAPRIRTYTVPTNRYWNLGYWW